MDYTQALPGSATKIMVVLMPPRNLYGQRRKKHPVVLIKVPGRPVTLLSMLPLSDLPMCCLMAAEAEVELGNLEKAREYVNMVRTRASNPAGFVMNGGAPAANYVINTYAATWTDATVARNAVRFERKLELSGEGHRFFDLVRWGVAATTLNAYLAYERSKVSASPFVGASFEAGKAEYMPIPQVEMDILKGLTQNAGY